jgi:hypothetical protein
MRIRRPDRYEDILAWADQITQALNIVLGAQGNGDVRVSVGSPAMQITVRRVRDRAFAAGKEWPKSTWTGEPTRWLCVYRDGVTAPAYLSQQTWEAGRSGGMPANAEYFDLEADDIHVDGF